tara:strand:- start:249 stop:647 length:399 start_codon:yes stop_codon:yes gene_type:complete
MFYAILASILLSIRNLVFKKTPSSIEALNIVCMTAIIWGIIGALIYPFSSSNTIPSDVYFQLVVYSVVAFLAQVMMQYAFLNSDNIAMTAAVLSINIVFTLLLDSFISGEIKANKKQLIGVAFIILGTTLTK